MKNNRLRKQLAIVFGSALAMSGMFNAAAGDMTVKGKITGDSFAGGVFTGDGSGLSNLAESVYKYTILVSNDGAELLAAINDLKGVASSAFPYLIKLEPGLYDLGFETLQMLEYVDIEGSGEGITRIRGGMCSHTRGVVTGANHAELRFLTVENFGTGENCAAFYNNGKSTSLLHTTVKTYGTPGGVGASTHYGIRLLGGTSTITHVTASATEGNNNYALHSVISTLAVTQSSFTAEGGAEAAAIHSTSSETSITQSTASASSATTNYGVYVSGKKTGTIHTIRNTVVKATGGGNNRGVHSKNADINIWGVDVSSEKGTVTNFGLRTDGSGSMDIDQSRIKGVKSISNDNHRIAIASSKLEGSVESNGFMRCIYSFDALGGVYTELTPSCVPK